MLGSAHSFWYIFEKENDEKERRRRIAYGVDHGVSGFTT